MEPLAHDNAFALDPAMTDPFPNARGWTMMYLAMHDALNVIEPRCQAIALTLRSFFGTDRVSFETQSTTALPSHPVRAFNRLNAASRECPPVSI